MDDGFDMPDITPEEAAIIVGNTPDEEIVSLYVAAWRLWRIVRRTSNSKEWLESIAVLGAALDVEYEAPLILNQQITRS